MFIEGALNGVWVLLLLTSLDRLLFLPLTLSGVPPPGMGTWYPPTLGS